VIPKISVNSGDINDLETKPTIGLMLDFGRKGDPVKAPVNPKVFENNEEVFYWGFKKGFLLSAEHIFIFDPIDNGRRTRFVHYKKMNGMLKSFAMTKKIKANMIERYILMNEDLKTLCEK
jgi:hypothetical protein